MKHVTGLAELIRILILQGEIASGELLIEVLLAERFRTSQSALREALRLLEGRGLLHGNESGGMRVVEIDAEELAETLEVRAALEALSAAEAAERRRPDRLPIGSMQGLAELVASIARGDGAEASAIARGHALAPLRSRFCSEPTGRHAGRLTERAPVDGGRCGPRSPE